MKLAGDRACATAAALANARNRAGRLPLVGELEGYCDSSACAVRYVTMTFKEYDGELSPRLRCPACGHPLKLHHVLTLDEAEAERRLKARRSVNAELYVARERERTGDADGPIMIPLDALSDELPGVVA